VVCIHATIGFSKLQTQRLGRRCVSGIQRAMEGTVHGSDDVLAVETFLDKPVASATTAYLPWKLFNATECFVITSFRPIQTRQKPVYLRLLDSRPYL